MCGPRLNRSGATANRAGQASILPEPRKGQRSRRLLHNSAVEIVRKFAIGAIRAVLARFCLPAALLASPAGAAALLTLDQSLGPLNMASSLEAWRDANGQASVEKVEASANTLGFSAVSIDPPYELDNAALWLRFDAMVQNPQTRWKHEIASFCAIRRCPVLPGAHDAGGPPDSSVIFNALRSKRLSQYPWQAAGITG